MTFNGILQILVFFVIVLVLTKPVGIYIEYVYAGKRTLLSPIFNWFEQVIYRVTKTNPDSEMNWKGYTRALLMFSIVSTLFLYIIQRLQGVLPINPQGLSSPGVDLAFNTAVSFVTNTDWQAYAGEATMSYLTQMAGLAVQNFLSAGAGMAVAIAFIRGIARTETDKIGNFWVDLVRGILYILLPIAFLAALFFVSQGVVQNFRAYDKVALIDQPTLQPDRTHNDGNDSSKADLGNTNDLTKTATQTIAQGPVASQLAIKMLGTNGGGFLNANSAHPLENPTPLSNFLQMLLIFLIPAGFTYTLGRMVGSQGHGWAVFWAMSLLFLAGVFTVYWAESRGNPLYSLTVDQSIVGGNMEGKEVRFGVAGSALFATVTTDSSCGAVNSMHDSFMPIGGMVVLVNMMLGEVVFGGVGGGTYGILVMVILSVFIAGLMVGRTPEYLGKKVEAFDVKMAMLYTLIFPATILIFAAWSALSPDYGLAGIKQTGPHGLTELIYAYVSAAANNGSAFAGLNSDTWWFNTTLGLAMLIGRFLMIIPILAIAGNLAGKKISPPTLGSFPVNGWLFTVLLLGVIIIVGGLTFFPVLSLAPLLEHFQIWAGHSI